MFKTVLKTKFELPLTRKIFWKNRKLYKEFSLLDKYPLTVIQAPLGYGKTKNLALYLKDNFPGNSLYWYRLHKEDNNIIDLWHGLVYLFYKYQGKTVELFYNNDKNKLELIINNLLNYLDDKLTADTFLVLDNYQLINKQEIISSLAYFIDLIPNRLHLILISRNMISFPQISSWQINKEVFFLDKSNFLLDREQLEDFLLIQHHLQLSAKRLEQLLSCTEGWLVAVDYIADLIKTGDAPVDLAGLVNDDNNLMDSFYNYLDYEILNNSRILNNVLKKYLLESSILKELKLDICQEFMEVADCEELIKYFLEIGLPFKKIGRGVYQYNSLFHDYLNNRAREKYNFETLHQKAFKIYKNKGNTEGEVYHLIELNAQEPLVNLIKIEAAEWLKNERFDLLESSLEHLPRNSYIQNPELYICQGDLFFWQNKLEQALKVYQQAEIISYQKGDSCVLIKALLKLMNLYFSVHSIQGLYYLDKLKGYKNDLSAEQYQDYISNKITAMFITGDVKGASSLLAGSSDMGGDIDRFKAMTSFIEGNLQEAIDFILSIDSSERDYFLESLHIVIHLFRGEKYHVRELLWKGMESTTGIISLIFERLELTLFEIMGSYKARNNRIKYRQLLKDTRGSILDTSWYNRETVMSLLNWEAYFGDPERGLKFAEERMAGLKEEDYFYKIQLKHMIGINHFAQAEYTLARKCFNEAVEAVASLGNQLNTAVSLYWLVLTRYQEGLNFESDIKHLLELAKTNSYDFLFITTNILSSLDPNNFIPILLECRAKGIERDYINSLLARVDLLEIEQHPGYTLRFKTLGGFKLYRGNKVVKDEEWKRSKSQELLYLLLINYGESLPRERLYNYLWPDKVDKTAKQNFYVAFSSLNKILEPDRKTSQQACFIESNDSHYGLTRRFACSYDADQFEELISRGRKSDNEYIKIKYYQEAVDIYQGNFLPDVIGLPWVEEERERLKKIYLRAAVAIMEYYYYKNKYQVCIETADKIQTVDNCIDELYLYKMKSYHQLGKHGMVIKTYYECNEIFKDELGIAPDPAVEDFYKRISL